MKNKLIKVILLLITIIATCFCFVGCNRVERTNDMLPERFVAVESAEGNGGYSVLIYDKYTKVMYLYVRSSTGCTITVLYDKNGKPLLYTGDSNNA